MEQRKLFIKNFTTGSILFAPSLNEGKPFLVVTEGRNDYFKTIDSAVDFINSLGYMEMVIDENGRLLNEKEIVESRLTND